MALDRLNVLLDVKVKGLEQVDQLSKKFGMMNVQMNKGGRIIDSTSKQFVSHEQVLQRNIGATNKLNKMLDKQQKRFDMNTLSWMFGGMALQMVAMRITRFFIPSMDKLNKLQTAGSKKVLGMVAAFEFLKISIFETLSQTPMFQKFVEWIIKGAIWISEFAQKHPQVVAMTAAIAGVAVVLGTLAIGVGIFKQLSHLLLLLGIGESGAVTGGGVLGAISKIGGALLVGWSIKMILEDVADMKFDLFDNVLSAAMLTIGLKMAGFGWKPMAGVWTFIILTALEILLDPKGFGAFEADLANYLTTTLEAVGGLFRAFLMDAKAIFTRDKIGHLGDYIENWFDGFFEGFEERVLEIEQEGKLSHTLTKMFSEQIANAKIPPFDYGSVMQWTGEGKGYAIDPNAMSKSNEELNILVQELPNANKLLGIMKDKVKGVDDELVTKSLVPSMTLLNEEFMINITYTESLIELYPILIEETNNQASAVDNLSSSYKELASSIREWLSAKEEKDDYKSSITED